MRTIVAALAAFVAGQAQTASFRSFQAMGSLELVQGEARLRQVGAGGGHETLVLSAAVGRRAEPDTSVVTVTPDELRGLVDAASKVEAVGAARSPRLPMLALTLVSGSGARFEVLLDRAQSRRLVARLHSSLPANAIARKSLRGFSCGIGGADGSLRDVTDQASIAFSGLRFNRATGAFVGTVTVSNTGAARIDGPLSVAVQAAGNVEVAGADAFSCQPGGAATPMFAIPQGTLGPGESVTTRVEFLNPERGAIRPSARVFAGAVDR
jgi:hypothetical protein